MTPERIQLMRTPGWTLPEGAVCVTKPGRWANRVSFARVEGNPASHAEAVALYRDWLMAPGQAPVREEARRKLRGRVLACSCKPHLPCHADVLLEVANGPPDPPTRAMRGRPRKAAPPGQKPPARRGRPRKGE